MQSQRFACAAVALSFLCACSGAMQSLPSSVDKPGMARQSARHGAKLEVRLKIPKRRHHRRRGEHYVSASTQSITIAEGTKTLGTFNTTASSGKCTAVSGGTLCSFTLGILTGKNQTFTVNTYDQTGGKGNLLSTGKVTKTILPGLNVIPITLDGVIASIAVALVDPNPPAGTAASTGVVVMANDAGGNTIVGPGEYSEPITLTDSDARGATALSTMTVNGPNDSVTMSYTGASLSKATIGATASGVTNVTAATFQPVPTAVADFQLPSAIGSNTNVNLSPVAITKGADGNLWFSAAAGSGSPGHALFKMTTSGVMTEFVPGTLPSTNLPDDQFAGLAPGSDGNVWYAGNANVGNIAPSGAVTNVALSGVAGICSGFNAQRIVPAVDGGLWVSVTCSTGSQLLHVTTGGVVKVNTLPSVDEKANGLVVGSDGKVYIAGYDGGTTPAVFAVTVNGDTVTGTPSVLDMPASFGSQPPVGIAQSTDGDLWLTNEGCDVSAFARIHLAGGFSLGSVSVFDTLAGCAAPAYLTALSDGTLWIPENSYAEASQVIPSGEGTPAQFALALPNAQNFYANMWDSTVGPDGDVYMTDLSGDATGVSADILKVAY